METSSRVLPMVGIQNFRDFGGYRTADGAYLPSQRLYRSAQPANPIESDLALIAQLNLSAVVDLRGSAERTRFPVRLPESLAGSMLFTEGETSNAPPHVDAARSALDARAVRRTMNELYAGMPFRPRLIEIYRRYFRALADSTGPTLVFCAGGKDRTGILVALTHSALGVHRDDIFDDYLLTNSAAPAEARVNALRGELQYRIGNLSEEALHVAASVEPEFLQTALDAIDTRCGSIDSYLELTLGMAPSVRSAVIARLLA